MEFQIPEHIRSLTPYIPGKPIEETQREFKIKKVVKLASNENPLGPSPKSNEAIRAQLKELHRYPDSSAFQLKEALSRHLGVSPAALILGNGSNEVIDHLVRTYCVPGDAIVTPRVSFVAYRICAQIHGVKTLEANSDSNFNVDLDHLVGLVENNQNVRMVFIANPNNPTGTYIDSSKFSRLLARVAAIRAGSVLVVVDHAYLEYVTASDFANSQDYLKDHPNLVVLRTFSKVYGLAGLRLGYGISSPKIVSHLEKVRQPFNINSLALAAGKAALLDTAFVKKSKKLNDQGMRFWEKNLTELGIPFWKSQGNFLLADFEKGTGKTGAEIYLDCLKRGVIFRPVANYGLPGAIRITIGNPDENEWAVRALKSMGLNKSVTPQKGTDKGKELDNGKAKGKGRKK